MRASARANWQINAQKMRPAARYRGKTTTTKTSSVFLVTLLSIVIPYATQSNYPQLVQAQAISRGANKLEQVRQKLFNLNEADENGIYLLGLFDVHLKSSRLPGGGGSQQAAKSFTCGPIDVDSGETSSRRPLQNLWAFLWAIEQVNQDDTLLPGVRLGSLVLDTCSSELQTSQQLANLLHGHHDDKLPRASQFAAMLADQRHWRSVEATATIASSQGLPTFVTQTRSTKLSEPDRAALPQRDFGAPGGAVRDQQAIRQADERMLGGLLGIGSMMAVNGAESANALPTTPETGAGQDLRLIKMLPGNEMLADALASLCDHLKWDLISIVYDAGEPDLLDLHDELIRELLLRNTQLALDEPLVMGELDEFQAQASIERILLSLARKTQMGSRVVISLLGIKSARRVQAKLRELRRRASDDPDGVQLDSDTLRQLNSLQWITITDREPYYSFATDSLGVIAISGAGSLMPEFAHYYDQLRLVEGTEARNQSTSGGELEPSLGQPRNKWWLEYVRSLVAKQRQAQGGQVADELLVNECTKWMEPAASPIARRCKQLSLAKLAELVGPSDKQRASKPAAAPPNRFLAAGWDHNGMDVINSVLAAANGLESLRQTLCPNVTVGLCAEMRQLVAPTSATNTTTTGEAQRADTTLGELVHDELLKLNFQLADGQWFRLNQSPYGTGSTASAATASAMVERVQKSAANSSASTSGGGGSDDDGDLTLGLLASGFLPLAQERGRAQLDTRLKFYNLRFLRSNRSIGFVKFAQFSLDEGIFWQEHAYSQALHYSSLPANFSDASPIAEVKSSCTDENRCLMLSALMSGLSGGGDSQHFRAPAGASSPQQLSEEQLAANFNSLFKLDHPLISGLNSTGHPKEVKSDRNGGVPAWVLLWEKLHGRVRSMVSSRPQFLSVPLSDPFESAAPSSANNKTARSSRRGREFEVLVLLPVHKANKSASASLTTCEDCCGRPAAARGGAHNFRLDEAHSFQQLAALAFAQQLVNGQLAMGKNSAPRIGNHDQDDNDGQTGTPNSTTTSRTNRASAANEDELRPSSELAINVIDYCGQIDSVDGILSDYLSFHQAHAKWLEGNADEQIHNGASALPPPRLVAVIDFDSQVAKVVDGTLERTNLSSSLLHLTIARHVDYEQRHKQQKLAAAAATHHDHLRIDLLPDKAREIEALVELIESFPNWRLVHLIYTDSHDYRDEFVRRANERNICVSKLIWIPQVDEEAPQRVQKEALDRTRKVFKQELFDYSEVPRNATNNTKGDNSAGQSSTRLLVVLASSSDATNKLIHEAASRDMLREYVWVTSHEWLDSVDRALERSSESSASVELPSHFLSTKMETFQEHHFREYFGHLLPALPGPIPRDWFDEFWQQKFQCNLPSARSGGSAQSHNSCDFRQRLDWSQMAHVDDLVPYTIRAIESLHVALSGIDSENHFDQDGQLKQTQDFARDFRLAFDLGTREVVGNANGNTRPSQPTRFKPLVGFHIVHRLIPSQRRAPAKRPNDRQLASNELVRIGLWRDHYQLRPGSKLALLPFKHNSERGQEQVAELLNDRGSVLRVLESFVANSTGGGGGGSKPTADEPAEPDRDTAKSLNRLAKFDSKCHSKAVCKLCKRQIGLTMSIIQQEETRLRLSESRVVGGSALTPLGQFVPVANKLASSLDSPSDSNFAYDDENNDEDDDEGEATNAGAGREAPKKQQVAEPLSAAASSSSMFDARTSQQEANQTRRAYRRREQHQLRSEAGAGWTEWLPNVRLSAGNLRRHSQGALLSLVSLLGVAFTVATMAYFNASMPPASSDPLSGALGPGHQTSWPARVKKFNQSQRSTSSSQCDMVLEDECDDEQLNKMLARMRPTPNSFLGSILANAADYLMLTGLLMLYSINMAFLLPAASVAVCWLRRIGLPLSYTLLFGAILAKVREIYQQSARIEASVQQMPPARTGRQLKGTELRASKQQQQQQQQPQLEPVEESVEITFESLTNNQTQLNELGQAASIQVPEDQVDGVSSHPRAPTIEQLPGGGNSLKLVLLLLLIQVAGSLVWLSEQPPEPSLHQVPRSCWHCASPTRSPLMFLYEPLLSLLLPGTLLVLSWLWSIVVYNRISSSDTRFGRAMRHLIMQQPLSFTQMQNPDYLRFKHKQLELADQLHHSKLLVITNTLLVLLWASITLSIASASQSLLRVLTSGGGSPLGSNTKLWLANGAASATNFQHDADDSQSLVCMNLLSGAIVFLVLFVYRLNWLTGCLFATKARKSQYDQISSTLSFAETSSRRRTTTFRLFRRPRQRGSTTISHPTKQPNGGDLTMSDSSQQQQQQLQQQQQQQQRGERVKLQHFSMTYGTYSAGTSSETQANVESAITSRSEQSLHNERSDSHGPATSEIRDRRGKSLDKKESKSKSIFKLRKSSTGRGSIGSNSKQASKQAANNRLQRRQSNGSVASSQANLMRRFSDFDLTDNDYDVDDLDVEELSQHSAQRYQHPNQIDTISCAMSVASNSTSQLQGNDLYPIDCSIQLDSQPINGATPPDKMGTLDEEQQQQRRPAAVIKLGQVEV